MFRRALKILGPIVLAFGLSCASPTLPLPPPIAPTETPSSLAGHVHLSSYKGAEPNAIIVIVNQNPSVPLNQRVGGAQADGEGTWDADVYASPGDFLDITQEFGSTRSPSTSFHVR